MPTLAVAKDAMRDYAKLSKPIRDKVDGLFEKFSLHTHAGIHLEKLNNSRDPRLRTVRVDDFWRGLVLAPETGDSYVLTRIVTHDEADRWAPRHVFKVNAAYGALEIIDVTSAELPPPGPGSGPASGASVGGALLGHIDDATLQAVGVDDIYLPMLRLVTGEAQLLSYLPALPELQQQAVSLLLGGLDADTVLDVITGGQPPEQVDPDDIGAALARPASASNFLVTADDAALREALNQPFDLWRTFLHPQQRTIAYRSSYRGSARVTGGAGTGKTVLAIHRARHLARRDPDAAILLTTYTTTLAEELRSALRVLGGAELAERVQVSTVDALARAVLKDAGQAPASGVLLDLAEEKLWKAVADKTRAGQGRFSADFLCDEWRQVILAQDLPDLPAYLAAARTGRGVRLSRADREAVWGAVQEFHRLRADVPTILQVAAEAAHLLADGTAPTRYDHILVDEAQDLHPVQWRLLRAVVPPGPDDLFIVGDAHQRIYDNRVTLSSLGIEVRGRAHRLTVSYRTTAQILALATRLLGNESYDDFDGGLDTIAGYHSPLRGLRPDLEAFDDQAAELRELTDAIRLWLESGVAAHEIAVLARTKRQSEEAVAALTGAGIAAVRLKGSGRGRSDSIQVMTMHRAKGLEFRCVAIHGVDAETVPLTRAITPLRIDAARHRQDQMRERSLLFVACTRARDALRISWTGTPSPFLPT